MSSSRISSDDSSQKETRKRKKLITSFDQIFRENIQNAEPSEDTEKIVARAEALARDSQKMIVGTKKNLKMVGSKREYAQALHRQADLLHHKGDYETALVLYHRAASACPRETSHGVSARRTAAAISSSTNPSKPLKKIPSRAKNTAQLVGISCPETAAQRAQKIVEESADPVSAIDQILKYFDSRKDFLQEPPIFRDRRRSTLISRSRTMLRQLGSLASSALEKLQASFASGDFSTSLRIGDELLAIAEPLSDRYRYEVAAQHYLAMTQISLGRHDRAIEHATRMIGSAKKSNDVALRSRSFMTLGKVHLTFKHLDAAARAWERLARDIEDAVPKAWLYHEIGRCYYEMKNPGKALDMSHRCLEYADEGNSRKWLMYGKLLSGQALVDLERLGEAITILREAKTIAGDEKDNEMREYVSDLIDRIIEVLRRDTCCEQVLEPSDDEKIAVEKVRRAKSEDLPKSRESGSLGRSREKSENFVTKLGLKPKVLKSRGIRISNDPRARNFLNEMKSTNITSIIASSFSLSPRQSEILNCETFKINNIYPEDDSSDDGDQELLTSRTRILRKKIQVNEQLIQEYLNGNKIVLNKEQPSGDEPSNRTGETYVLDGLLKFTRNKKESSKIASNESCIIRHSGSSLSESEKTNKTSSMGILCDSDLNRYFNNEGKNYEYSSEAESKVSLSTTGMTYLVDDDEIKI